jgi:NUMOD4 motif
MEQWRSIRGYEGLYDVSDLGNVLSVRSGRLLALNTAQWYLRVTLSKDGRSEKRKVHQLVADAFLPPRPPGTIPAHGPGGHLDNSAVNLSWKTQAQNIGEDRRRDGTGLGGPKLTEAIVRECRLRHNGGRGERIAVLAEETGVALEHMRLVVTGKCWAHVA